MSPALADRFFTAEPPGKPQYKVRRGESLIKRNGKDSGLRKSQLLKKRKDGWIKSYRMDSEESVG